MAILLSYSGTDENDWIKIKNSLNNDSNKPLFVYLHIKGGHDPWILNDEEKRTTEGFDTARATLHKLRGASSTLGAEGIQHTCESLREAIVAEARDALSKGPGSLEELENRLNELKNFLKRYTCIGRECASRKLSRK